MPLFCAIDWASQSHYAMLQDSAGRVLYQGAFEHTQESIRAWVRQIDTLRGTQPVALIFEATKHGLIDVLLEYDWIELIAVHPLKTKMLQKLEGESLGKSDPRDTKLLCDYLRVHYERLRQCYVERQLSYRILQERIDQESSLIARCTQSLNRIHSIVRRLCPEWDVLVPLLDSQVYRDFMLKYAPWDRPTAKALRSFLTRHNVRGDRAIHMVIELAGHAQALGSQSRLQQLLLDTLRSEVRILDALKKELRTVEGDIQADFCVLPQANIYLSMPGVGARIGPRLASLFGSEPCRHFQSKNQALSYAGQSPLTVQSGNSRSVEKRTSCNKHARNLCFLWAKSCNTGHPEAWIGEYLEALKRRGDKRPTRYRKLGAKLLGILHACLRTNTPYDASVFLRHRLVRKAA